jgi:hypothetical protein
MPTAPPTARGEDISGGPSRRRLGAIAAVAVVLGIVTLLLILHWSARAVSADGTFMISFSAASTQFDHLRDTSLQAVLDSWRWK